jgi:hypothetical protein
MTDLDLTQQCRFDDLAEEAAQYATLKQEELTYGHLQLSLISGLRSSTVPMI